MTTTPVPQRFESIEPSELPKYVPDNAWVVEPKVDGHRCLVSLNGEVEMFTHGGRPKFLAKSQAPLVEQLRQLKDLFDFPAFLDGELIGPGFVLFDLIGKDGDTSPFWLRREDVEMVGEFAMQRDLNLITVIPQAKTPEEKVALIKAVLDAGAEGVVLKRRDARYGGAPRADNRVSHTLKCKFLKTADVVITARNSRGHSNADYEVYDRPDVPLGQGIPLGAVTCYWPTDENDTEAAREGPPVKVGEVWEVSYLSWQPGGKLTQPCLIRRRDDKLPGDCDLAQLIPTTREVVDFR